MRAEERLRAWTERLLTRVPPAELQRLAATILSSVDEVATQRWESAVTRAARLPGELRPEKLQALTRQFARELAAVGGAAGAVAATPLIGTTGTMVAALGELGWFTARCGDLILTIAALHGRPNPTVDERRAWVLALLIFGGSARDGLSRAINEANTGLVPADVGAQGRLPLATVQRANRTLGKLVVRRYGSRRGAVALGTALPLGIGAVVGGGFNYVAIRRLAEHADQFFARLPYSAVDATAIEVGLLGG